MRKDLHNTFQASEKNELFISVGPTCVENFGFGELFSESQMLVVYYLWLSSI